MWALILVVFLPNEEIKTELLSTYNHKPSCELAVKGRTLIEEIENGSYVCVKVPEGDKDEKDI